jgi:hypothetical protein|tara:strand:- start:2178 stop:3038 length:861 start_codon:yes stop_codon:yes gene_type:complete
MSYKLINNTNTDLSVVEGLIEKYFPYAQENLRFDQPVSIYLESDLKNSHNPLGKTAHYEPNNMAITIYVDGRHPKDIMRSVSHELTHHAQNCAGHFENLGPTEEGYAQKDPHLRKMEEDAYLRGNLVFRDWENSFNLKENVKMKVNEETLKNIIQSALQQVFEDKKEEEAIAITQEVEEAAKPDFLDLDKDGDKEESMKDAADSIEEADDTEDNPVETTINEASADEDSFACEEGEVYNENSEECEDAGAEEAPSPAAERATQQESLDTWYQGTLYEKLLKEWTKK